MNGRDRYIIALENWCAQKSLSNDKLGKRLFLIILSLSFFILNYHFNLILGKAAGNDRFAAGDLPRGVPNRERHLTADTDGDCMQEVDQD